MVKLFREHKSLLLIYSILVVLSTLLVFIYGKAEIHIFINKSSHFLADVFFKYITHLGDGVFAGIVILILVFVKFRDSLTQLLAALLAGFGAQLLKRVFFSSVVRPARYFEDSYELYFVEGVRIYKSFSFPSGHTATAFAIAFCLIFTTRNRSLQFMYLLLAILVGYSRMYLSLHFLPDVIAGSLIGFLAALIAYSVFNNINKSWPDRKIRIPGL